MNRIIILFLLSILISGCSLNKNSKFWTNSKNITEEKNIEFKEIFQKDKKINKEFNPNIKIKLTSKSKNNSLDNLLNNTGRLNFNGNLKKSSRYNFSKIDYFSQYQPEITFFKKNLIFFDNKGSILQFNEKSKLIWKKNYYSKSEKKLKPILQFTHNEKYLVVVDNIAKYYLLDIETGELIWSKTNLAPFNSQIKIYEDKFFVIDLSNTLRCFSLKDGKELWKLKTENSLIRSQKKLSLVIVNNQIFFINSLGDLSAVDINNGSLLWQLPTQSSKIYESSFSLQTSDIISDKKTLFFSNNKNQFFSVDINTGSFNWENKINSNLRSILIKDYLITVSLEGLLLIIEKKTGNIVRATDIFKNYNEKKRNFIKPTGFLVGLKNIYVSTNIGRLLVVDIETGKTNSILKIDSEKISKPFVKDNNLFLIKDNSIIKLN